MSRAGAAMATGLLALALAGPGHAAPQLDVGEMLTPGEVLRRSRAAIDRALTLRYGFHYAGTGSLAGDFSGAITIRRPWRTDRAWIRAVVVDRSSGNPERPDSNLLVASDGEQVQVMDVQTRKLIHGSLDAGASQLLATAYRGIPVEFLTSRPLDGGARGAKLRYVGGETVDEVECHLVEVVTPVPGGEQLVLWYVGKEDYLPRRQRIDNRIPGTPGAMTLDLKELERDALVGQEAFRLPESIAGEVIPLPGPAIQVGAPAPPFKLRTPGGREVTLEEQRGKVAVLLFWASWSPRCRLLMEELGRLSEDLAGRDVAVLGINAGEPGDAARAFLKKHPSPYPVLLGGDEAAAAYGLAMPPALFVVDREGRFLQVDRGLGTPDLGRLRALLDPAATGGGR